MPKQSLPFNADRENSAPLTLPASLQHWTGALLGQATRQLRYRFEQRLAPLGIRSRHFVVLVTVEEAPRTQTEIGRLLGVDRTTMVALIDVLEKAGYVARARPPGDRRAYAVTLTDAGRNALREGNEAAHATEEETMSALEPDERSRLRELLARLIR